MKKTIMALMLAIIVASTGVVIGVVNEPSANTRAEEQAERYDYVFEKMITPLWKTNTIYNESVLMQANAGKAACGTLAFTPFKIISVRDYSLTKEFKEGTDYTFDSATKTLTLTAKSTMPSMKDTHFTAAGKPSGAGFNDFPSKTGANISYSETPYIFKHQIFVTYTYDNTEFSSSAHSVTDLAKLPKTKQKLSAKEPFKIAVLGDSISEGANSSGMLNVEPYFPNYSGLIRQALEKKYDTSIEYENYSLGGQKTAWGEERSFGAAQANPDLAIIAYGMNDAGTGSVSSPIVPTSAENYKRSLEKIITNISELNPQCEFIIISPMLANPTSAASGIERDYAKPIAELALNDNSIVGVDMGTTHQYLLDCGKKYIDMNSNNVNHPNDFFMRIYAMNVLNAFMEF